MSLTKSQASLLSHYFADLSKILFGSTVVGYVIPNTTDYVTPAAFLAGVIVGLVCLLISVESRTRITHPMNPLLLAYLVIGVIATAIYVWAVHRRA